MRERKKKRVIIFSLLGLLCVMTVGYATYPYTPKLKKSYNTRLNSYRRVRINQAIYSFFLLFF